MLYYYNRNRSQYQLLRYKPMLLFYQPHTYYKRYTMMHQQLNKNLLLWL